MLHRSKFKWLWKYVEARSVLDLGCVCHELDVANPPWLHGYLREVAERVVGVDYLPVEIEELRRRGYEVVCADVQTMDLGETFEVVVAGDIIEHVENLGDFLDRVAAHLQPGGLFLVTTPNPIMFLRWFRLMLSGRDRANREHTCWFTAKVLRQLAERHGFEMIDESYADETRFYYRLWPKVARRGGRLRYAWRRTRMVFKRLLWRPWVWLNTLMCLVRPRNAERLCLALRLRESPGQGLATGET